MKDIEFIYVIRDKKTREISSAFGSKRIFTSLGHIKSALSHKLKVSKKDCFKIYDVEIYSLNLVDSINILDLHKVSLSRGNSKSKQSYEDIKNILSEGRTILNKIKKDISDE